MSNTKEEALLDILFTADQADEVAGKILLATKEKLNEQLVEAFYRNTEGFLYETYLNAAESVKSNLIDKIADKYVSNPAAYEYKPIRERLWAEHKDEIIGALTDEAIHANLQRVLLKYTHSDYNFNWQFKDGVAQLIMENWPMFSEDERIASAFGRELERLRGQVSRLKSEIEELNSTN